MNPNSDSRIDDWPSVSTHEGKLRLEATILPPSRLYILRECLFTPLYRVWQCLGILMAIQTLIYFKPYLSVSAIDWLFYIIFIGGTALCYREQICLFPFFRYLIGERLEITVDEDSVTIKRSNLIGTPWQKTFTRDGHQLTFAMEEIKEHSDLLYKKSYFLYLVMNDQSRFKCGEIFNTGIELRIASHANIMLQTENDISGHDFDIDPARRQLDSL